MHYKLRQYLVKQLFYAYYIQFWHGWSLITVTDLLQSIYEVNRNRVFFIVLISISSAKCYVAMKWYCSNLAKVRSEQTVNFWKNFSSLSFSKRIILLGVCSKSRMTLCSKEMNAHGSGLLYYKLCKNRRQNSAKEKGGTFKSMVNQRAENKSER